MTVKVILPYKPSTSGLYYVALDVEGGGKYLNNSTGLFETYDSGNEGFYHNQFIDALGEPGTYAGVLPEISTTILPKRVTIFCFDPATMAADGPIGQGEVYVDGNNNEQNDPKLLNNIFASTVGNNLGVGTTQESYYGADNFLAFTSIFDTNGNRQVTIE